MGRVKTAAARKLQAASTNMRRGQRRDTIIRARRDRRYAAGKPTAADRRHTYRMFAIAALIVGVVLALGGVGQLKLVLGL